jgi:type 2 lantibiotic biosynthesis protein LanM
VDPDDAGLFDRRLAWDGLTAGSARALLAGGAPDRDPDWCADLDRIRTAARRADESFRLLDSPVAFAEVLQPIVDWGWDQLDQGTPPAAMAALLPTARADLRDGLLRRLSEVCGQALYADFRTTRPAGQSLLLELGVVASAPPGRVGYDAWCRQTRRAGYEQLLARHPVLGRLLTVVVHQWIGATTELLARVHRDRAGLRERFEVPVTEQISAIRSELGDPHRGGRSVALLSFGSGSAGRRLVYKPKDLRIDEQYQRVLRRLDSWTGQRPTASVEVLACGTDHGYVSFVEAVPCAGAEELRRFYRSAGRLLAALHVLGATDAHFENLIAAGPELVLVDTETLLQGTVAAAEALPRAGADGSQRAFAESVMRVGMLPSWVVGGTDQQAHDFSALGVAAAGPSIQVGWVDANTDRMAWGRSTVPAPRRRALPVPTGTANPLRDHVADLVGGFTETYRAAAAPAHRQELLDLLDGFADASRRLVLRATKVYAAIHRLALSGEALTSANHRAAALERLSRSALVTGHPSPHWQAFHAELRDMEDLDVPLFDHALGSLTVNSSIGPIDGLLVTDGLAEARERVLALSEDDLAWQVRLIRMSVRARYAVLQDRAGASPDAGRWNLTGVTSGGDPAVARQIVAGIEDAAVVDGTSGRSWLVLSLLPDAEHVQLGPVNHSLYDGRTGMAVFLELARRAGIEATSADVSADVLGPVIAALAPAQPYDRYRYLRDLGPGFVGVGGLLRGLQLLDPATVPAVCAAMDRDLIVKDMRLDLLGGCAGLVAPLVRYQQQVGDDRAGRLIEAAAGRLADEQLPGGGWPSLFGERPLTGLSHGASGAGLALLQAGAALGEPDLVAAGARAFAYEARVFDEEAGNWPDLREPPEATGARLPPMVAWCHGAPGIGLARLEALHLLPDHPDSPQWLRDLEVAMATTAHAPLTGWDHLCCGTTGRAAILRIAAARRRRADWAAAADQLTESVLHANRAAGRFRLPLEDPHGSQGSTPGLMTGTSGIGAHLVTGMTGDHLGALLL